MPPSKFNILGQSLTATDWDGSPTTLAVRDGVSMPQTPNGSMILAFQNASLMNNAGKLALTTGSSQPQFLPAPALVLQPTVLIKNWQANNLNLTNVSTAVKTPIWIAAYGPGIGATPATLTAGHPVSVAVYTTLQAVTSPQYMQLSFQANSGGLCLFAFLGGPQDANGNNAYAIALNSQYGDTGPGHPMPAPPGYYATAGGNTYGFEFNWGTSVLFVVYFGSGSVMSQVPKEVTALPTVSLQAL
ncbi:hypothetical protein EOA32_31770 [Mesorhizobium sp. M1A.F.Ca.ET.072.01.1.1]|uniref:hypothetical protein n=1 Tax=Mesorhizobium sp. M1A.F.Ca.ET.072.01.1.1 TaxID=2496753 RepID=UPI000FD228BB|nr:hypothetical protein [Mesorhizobium sp. M1A.F.Ca.ET.072.01.1.1]RUW46367.1 hypothetical protein EOA32_31770 [Mesorhizobium sp. M1A.F.Ca.ET.072.01.1.1]TIU97628.1 MAG: hypothetical protein E5W04_25560 [Mesorhizobium sp.]